MSSNLVLALIVNGSACLFFNGTTAEGLPVWSTRAADAVHFNRDEASHVRAAIPALTLVALRDE